jgi:hypothetical protein
MQNPPRGGWPVKRESRSVYSHQTIVCGARRAQLHDGTRRAELVFGIEVGTVRVSGAKQKKTEIEIWGVSLNSRIVELRSRVSNCAGIGVRSKGKHGDT